MKDKGNKYENSKYLVISKISEIHIIAQISSGPFNIKLLIFTEL